MKKLIITTLALCIMLVQNNLNAQKTGKVEYKHLGVEFTIPNGWVGQEGEGLFILGHNSIPGIVIITTHEAKTLDALKSEARQGIVDQNGTNLQMNGNFDNLDQQSIGANLSGTLEWQAVQGYIVGVLNPHGVGATIMSVSTPQQYSDQLKQVTLQVKNSFKFKKPETGPIVAQWKQEVGGRRLHHLNSYYSGGSIGGGYSDETIIELCPNGSFIYSSNNSTVISGDGISAYDSGNGNGNGRWEVAVNISGEPVLNLNFNNGEVYTYTLSFQEKYLHLNGKKFFRVNLEWCR